MWLLWTHVCRIFSYKWNCPGTRYSKGRFSRNQLFPNVYSYQCYIRGTKTPHFLPTWGFLPHFFILAIVVRIEQYYILVLNCIPWWFIKQQFWVIYCSFGCLLFYSVYSRLFALFPIVLASFFFVVVIINFV